MTGLQVKSHNVPDNLASVARYFLVLNLLYIMLSFTRDYETFFTRAFRIKQFYSINLTIISNTMCERSYFRENIHDQNLYCLRFARLMLGLLARAKNLLTHIGAYSRESNHNQPLKNWSKGRIC